MKRILFLHQVSYIGGGSYCLLSLLKSIDRKAFEPVVLLGNDGPLRNEIERLGIEVYFMGGMPAIPYNKSLLAFGCVKSYANVFKKQKTFFEILQKLKVDIVYLNNMMLYPYLKTAKKYGCKTVMHVREHWPKNEHQIQFSWAKNYVKRYVDRLIAINQFSASMFSDCSKNTSIVYDWIDFSQRDEPVSFDDIFKCDSSNLKVMVFTGGVTRIKGTYEVVKAFQKIKGDNYRLLVLCHNEAYPFIGLVGKIKKLLMLTGWKPYAYKSLQELQKDNRIVMIPPTYKIVNILKQAYCTLSFFNIPHANLALAEAVTLGTVAIAAKTEEAYEYADGGKAAVLYNFEDQSDFDDKIHYVINNYDLVKQEVAKHSLKIKKLFDPAANANVFNAVLKSLN